MTMNHLFSRSVCFFFFLAPSSLLVVANAALNDPTSDFFGGAEHNAEYQEWLAGLLEEDVYENTLYLPNHVDSHQGMAIHWSIVVDDNENENDEEPYLNLALATRATSWLGFGLTENGGMTGSDMLLYELNRQPQVVKDAYVLHEKRMPEVDCNSQDWELISSNVETATDFIMIEVRRKLVTGDDQDLSIDTNDATIELPAHRVIAAWGNDINDGQQAGGGVSFHGTQTARGAIRWFKQQKPSSTTSSSTMEAQSGDGGGGTVDTTTTTTAATTRAALSEEEIFLERMKVVSDGSFFVGPKQVYNIKPQETEYANFCTTANDLRAAGIELDNNDNSNSISMSLVGFAPRVDNIEHVHHFVIQASYSEHNNITTNEQCDKVSKEFQDIVYVWAPGEPPLAFPPNVGFALGGGGGDSAGGGYRSFQVQIHYDNPQLKQGAVDSSGVEFFYSNTPREHTAAFLVLGDPGVSLVNQTIARGLSDYHFFCPGECSALALESNNDTDDTSGDSGSSTTVTVVREYIHMHQSGASAYNEHIRDGQVIRTGKTQYFDFEQQGAQVVQQEPFEIRPGDSFHTRCFYQNEYDDDRKFGFASSDEMCMAFLLYYPRKELRDTGVSWVCAMGMSQWLNMSECESSLQEDVLTGDQSDEQSLAAMQRTFGMPSAKCLADNKNDESSNDIQIAGNENDNDHPTTSSAATVWRNSDSAIWTALMSFFAVTRSLLL